MAAFLDICRFNPAAGGVADWTYSSSVTGYQGPAAAGAVNGRLYKYRAESADLSQWELGEGAYNSGTGTLARATISSNSSGTTAKINFSAAPQVAIVALKADLVAIEEDNAFTDTQRAQARKNVSAAPFDSMLSNGLQVNGGMEVSQQNGTTAGTPPNGVVYGYYPADQFLVFSNGPQVVSAQNAADAPAGLTRSIKISVTTANAAPGAGDACYIRTKIEGYRAARLGFGAAGAQSLSIAFWVKAHRAGTYSGFIRNGSMTRAYPFSFAIGVADTWEYKTITIAGDTTGTWLKDNGIGLDIVWLVGGGSTLAGGTAGAWATPTGSVTTALAGVTGSINGIAATSDTFQITGVLLLPGTELPASGRLPLAMRSAEAEIPLCCRYFSISATARDFNSVAIGQIDVVSFGFPVPMRTAPTCSVFQTGANSLTTVAAVGTQPNNTYGGIIQFSTTGTGRVFWYGLVSSDARM